MKLILKNCDFDEIDEYCDHPECQLCNKTRGIDFFFDKTKPHAPNNIMTSPCCYSPLCPNCVHVETDSNDTAITTFSHLFI